GQERAAPEMEVGEEEGPRWSAGTSDRSGHWDIRPLYGGHAGESPGVLPELEPQPHDLVRQERETRPRRALWHEYLERIAFVVDRQDEVMFLGGLPHLPDQSDHGGGPVGRPELFDRAEVLQTRASPQEARERSEPRVEECRIGKERRLTHGRAGVPVLDQSERKGRGAGRGRTRVAGSGDRRPRPRDGRAALCEDRLDHLAGYKRADRVRALDHLSRYDERVGVHEEELQ